MDVFVSGGTGYMGGVLIRSLLDRGHRVSALARAGSVSKLPRGCRVVIGSPLEKTSFLRDVVGADTFVHLVGTPKPAPWKRKQFRAVDLVSLRQSVDAAAGASIGHFIYVSVAQPAPVMQSYIEVRRECEAHLAASKLRATVLRPWYVLGPGHWWPIVLQPFYKLGELLGSEGARRLGLVTLSEMVAALVWSVENPGHRVLDVPAIRACGSRLAARQPAATGIRG